jgi:small multidrug resistance pump
MRTWWVLAGAIASEVSATLALRASVDSRWWVPVVVVGYVAAFALLGLSLRAGMPLGAAYAIWGASGVALTAALGAVIFEELLSPTAVAGIGLVIVGVVLVESGSADRAGEVP